MKNNCVILVTNKSYLNKCLDTVNQLRTIGKYYEDIVVLIGDDLKNEIILNGENVIIKYFPEYDRSEVIKQLVGKPISDGREYNKTFQFHKIHCFDEYFKQWKKCFYIDVGINIYKPIQKFFEIPCDNLLLANSDAYPTYEWKLGIQFDKIYFPELYKELEEKYNMNVDYFQSTIMLYDSNIIESDTKDKLWELSCKYINSRTNEQAIMNLYFNCDRNIWKQIPMKDNETYYYDFWEREGLTKNNYIMLKRNK